MNFMKDHFWQKGGSWVLIQWILMTATLVAGPLGRGDWEGGASPWAAMGFLVLGSVFGIAGAIQLGRYRTIFPEPKAGSPLVQDGIFGMVRHPLYTSVISLSLAWALGWRSGLALLPALATVVFLDAKARCEEARLRKRFTEYDDYAHRVKRLIPFLY